MSHLHPKIELLRRQYLQLLDPGSLSLPEPQILKRPEIQSQMYVSMFRDSSVPYPPPVRYRFRVLKRLVSALEEAMEDPDEDVGTDCPYSLCQHYSKTSKLCVRMFCERF